MLGAIIGVWIDHIGGTHVCEHRQLHLADSLIKVGLEVCVSHTELGKGQSCTSTLWPVDRFGRPDPTVPDAVISTQPQRGQGDCRVHVLSCARPLRRSPYVSGKCNTPFLMLQDPGAPILNHGGREQCKFMETPSRETLHRAWFC
ncbi:hypothetical protein SCLCIDRAFT_308029 [Scleroderma citrinum Foug A]|uniref:Uncharacterized protein n=1 Tax=Scleroderma citrinum Foug A TaxID=1036808 RepID=A0A0C3DG10_9AGAM|nr:hypothetical protein SCLCIDRAFT_308029 [Scleroderma citrinum Foug A]